MYILIHNHNMKDEIDQKFIGIYDKYKKVLKIREKYKEIEGFNNQPNNFEIIEVEALDDITNIELPIVVVYILVTYKWNQENMDTENVKYHGVFYNYDNAKKYMKKNMQELCFKERRVEIDKAWINRNEWTEGFITYTQ